jgi:transposase
MMKNRLSIVNRAQHHWRTTMDEYIGLDVSMKETAISVRREGKRI